MIAERHPTNMQPALDQRPIWLSQSNAENVSPIAPVEPRGTKQSGPGFPRGPILTRRAGYIRPCGHPLISLPCRLARHARSRRGEEQPPAPSGMRSSAVASQDHQHSVHQASAQKKRHCACEVRGHHEAALGPTHAWCLNVAILQSCCQSSTSCPSTNCLAYSIAVSSSGHTSPIARLIRPSLSMM
jgi:hypothetical protein